MTNKWKTIAIIFVILFILETAFFLLSFWYVSREEKRTYECIYDICGENYDGWYENKVCTCYDLDMFGEYVIAKTKYIK